MYHKILQLLNVKPSESKLVRDLFTIQFFLGIATAFLFTSSLTMFISNYEITVLPVSYIISACLLFIFNRVYAYLEHRLSPTKLMQAIILFSAASIMLFWILLNAFPFKQLPLIIASWYMLIYMLVGYGFWGMASIIFNVRESKRLFSVVGAGDIPAKMLGYFSVTAFVPLIGINNLLWVSIISFGIAWILLDRFKTKALLLDDQMHGNEHGQQHDHANKPEHSIHTSGFITKFFDNRLVFSIALLSLVSYIVFSFIDFTFLSDIKTKYHKGEQIATFIGIFFAAGRLLAIGIKLLFSSRMISRIGLTNSLLVTPVLLLLIDFFIIGSGDRFISHLYIFGFMVLLTEILRSALQEPVFFILFQPLKPHDRLRGHLVAKGHTLPFALTAVGIFLVLYFEHNNELPILLVGELLVGLLLFWILAVFIIKNQYLQTLITSLKRGYFTGAELFLDDSAVTNLLLSKSEGKKPLEVIYSLNLLERSGYADIHKLMLKHLQSQSPEIKEYVLSRIIANNMKSTLPIIKQLLGKSNNVHLQLKLVKVFYFLNDETEAIGKLGGISSEPGYKKAALEGLLLRKQEEIEKLVISELLTMSKGTIDDKQMVLDIIFQCECENYTEVLELLLSDPEPKVYKKAIEAAGKVKNLELLPKVVEHAAAKKAYASLKRSVLFYGDQMFSADTFKVEQLQPQMLEPIVKACGSIKGDLSTNFLIRLMTSKIGNADEIVEALWAKKPIVEDTFRALIDKWVNEKIEQSKYKVTCYHEIIGNKNFSILQQALFAEVKKDTQLLLKAFSLMYDAEKIDRVIELLVSENSLKTSNAIEILELMIPKKYFLDLNNNVELIDDVQHGRQLLPRTTRLGVNHTIEEVIKNNKANFTEWTRSVACYTILKLKKNEVSLKALNVKESKEHYLFNETRDYVLNMLN